ncbi:glycosyltransferase [Pedobacter immunditicola]|uniref:glycosyltransferase n=1 Tax=Pedobacter immunditicola TaxID=3133440 RepID=UPI0030A724C6
MSLLFLGSFFSPNLEEHIRLNSKGAIANANNTLQWSFIEGLSLLVDGVGVITLPQVGAFPLKYKKPIISSAKFNVEDKIVGTSVGFFNLMGLKHISRYLNVKRTLIEYLLVNNGAATLIIYDLHVPFLKAAAQIKQQFPGLKICLIVPDLPGLTGTKASFLNSCFSHLETIFLKQCYEAVDYYVLLSKHMKNALPIGNKPWTVIEGIFNSNGNLFSDEACEQKQSIKKIFYAGVLHTRNGVINLIQAFKQIPDKNYQLIICGDGPAKDEVIAETLTDPRILYKGQLPRTEVLKLQKESTLLVNPRTPEGEFTKYSFPSKTMEYLSSGVPTLMYRLEGVPDEYYEYCYGLTDTSIKALTESMVSICEQDYKVLLSKAKLAQEFILMEKNPTVQCRKMLQLFKEYPQVKVE